MTLIGSPAPSTESYLPRCVGGLVAFVLMIGATMLSLAGLVVGTGGDQSAGLTYQLGLMWTLLTTVGAVTGTFVLAKRWYVRHGAWKAAIYGMLASVGIAVLLDVVGVAMALGVYRFSGA